MNKLLRLKIISDKFNNYIFANTIYIHNLLRNIYHKYDTLIYNHVK